MKTGKQGHRMWNHFHYHYSRDGFDNRRLGCRVGQASGRETLERVECMHRVRRQRQVWTALEVLLSREQRTCVGAGYGVKDSTVYCCLFLMEGIRIALCRRENR